MLISIFRTAIVYILILIAFRIMGKRQISQMQASELVTTIILSELAVMPIQNIKDPFINGIAPMVAIVILESFVAFLMMKSHFFRKLTCGNPIVLIEKGRVNQYNLKKVKMSVEDLLEQLRQKDAFSLDEVEYAIIETSGLLSVIKKNEFNAVTPKDMQIKVSTTDLEVVVVSDGVISSRSLALSGKSESWVVERVKANGFNIKEVFIMTLNTSGKYRIIPREI